MWTTTDTQTIRKPSFYDTCGTGLKGELLHGPRFSIIETGIIQQIVSVPFLKYTHEIQVSHYHLENLPNE